MRKQITLFDDQYAFYKELKSEKLLIAFVEYLFEDIEPTWLSSLEQTIRNSLLIRMNNQKNRSDAWSVWWSKSRWWWRPKKQAEFKNENKQKTSKKQTENKQDKEEDKDKENIISLSNDKEKQSFWNEDINELLDLIKSYNWWIVDWTIKEQRQYWKLLIDKLEKLESVKSWNYKRNQVLETILQIISQNTYHSQKIAWPKKIYYDLWSLMQICKSEFAKQKQSEIPFIPWIW